MIGKCSTFGGPLDVGMTPEEGLSLFEHHEADCRPDLFEPRDKDLILGASQRLRTEALYLAVRFTEPREVCKGQVWRLRNPRNGKWIIASLVDWGPHPSVGRDFDISPRAAELLEVNTDDFIDGSPVK